MFLGLLYLPILSHAVEAFSSASDLTWGHALDGQELVTIRASSIEYCYKACRARRVCFSLSYNRYTRTCKLSSGDTGTSGTQLITRTGYVYSQKASWIKKTLAPECLWQCSLNETCEVTPNGVSCAVKECRAPPVLDPQSSIHGNVRSVNAVVMYVCNDDNSVTARSTCIDTGEWSLQTFQCPTAPMVDGLNGNTYVIESKYNEWWVEGSDGTISYDTQPTDDTSKFIFLLQLDGHYKIVALSSMNIVHDGFSEGNSPYTQLYTSSTDGGHSGFNVVAEGNMYRIYTVATNRIVRMDSTYKVTSKYNLADDASLYKLKRS